MKFWIISILLFLVLVQSSRQDYIRIQLRFRVETDAGKHYEPYGRFRVEIGGRTGYVYDVARSSAGSVVNGEEQSFVYGMFYPSGSTSATLKGSIMENDSTGDDDLVGNYDGVIVPIADIENGYEHTFDGYWSGDWVNIRLTKMQEN